MTEERRPDAPQIGRQATEPHELSGLGKGGRYRLVEEIGAGGMAQVYRADDTALRREVAVKVLYRHLLRDPAQKARFVREARAAAGLDHPGILKVYDVDEGEDGVPYIVMELLRGRSLKAFLDESGAPLAEVVAMVGAMLADALSVAHAAGVIHRDLKPANVMVAGGRVVLCDFGVARIIDDDALATLSGMLLGTPTYMSPEQALGRKVDERSDIYCLGTTLYHLATGVAPFAGGTAAVIQDVVRAKVVPPLRRNPTIGGDLAGIIEGAMARLPEERPASARELKRALDGVAAASGFSDARVELAAYFTDPGGWNQRATPKILGLTVERARAAAASGKTARALALAERVLAVDPAHADANSLLARLGVASRRRRQAVALLAGAGGLALVGLGAIVLFGAAPTASAAPGAAIAVAVAAVPDATVSTVPDAAPLAPAPPPAPVPASAPVVVPATHDVKRPTPAPLPVVVRHPDAAVARAVVVEPPDAAVPRPVVPATLVVRVRPWCEITVDGVAHGRSPGPADISVPPGHHTVRCEQPGLGHVLTREIDVGAGERYAVTGDLLAEVAVKVDVHGSTVLVDGDTAAAGATLKLPPGRHRVELRRGDSVIGAAYVQVSTRACTIRESPVLACYED